MNEEEQLQGVEPQAFAVHGSQLRYTVARIKSAGYEILDVQQDGENYIVIVAMPAEAQLPERSTTTTQRRRQPIGRMMRGVGSGLIVIALGVFLLGPAVTTFGTGLSAGLVVASTGVLASSALLLPAALIVLLILSLLPFAAKSIVKAKREYGQ